MSASEDHYKPHLESLKKSRLELCIDCARFEYASVETVKSGIHEHFLSIVTIMPVHKENISKLTWSGNRLINVQIHY